MGLKLLMLCVALILLFRLSTQLCPFGLIYSERVCKDVDECTEHPGICLEHAKCINTNGSFYCQCDAGFKSRDTGHCRDINECLEGTYDCGPKSKCKNLIGSYTCSCPEGYVYQQAICQDVNECEMDTSPCGKHGSCENEDGSYQCKCFSGASNFGNSKARCVELECDIYKTNNTFQQTLPGLKALMSLMKDSCLELSNSTGGGVKMDGDHLLERVLTEGDSLLSSQPPQSGNQVTALLSSMENAVRLIGPQLKQPRTRIKKHHAEVELLVNKSSTPPRGPIHLSSDHAELHTTWETATGQETYPGYAFASLVTYNGLEASTNGSAHMQNVAGDRSFQVNSKVVTAYVSNPNTAQLPSPVTFTFYHLQHTEGAHRCVFWDTSNANAFWSPKGCALVESNETHTKCACNHLSSFAVLMALYEIEDTFQLQMITWVLLSLSLLCLFFCIITFAFCRSIHSTRTTIHLNLCVCLFIADLVFLAGISSTHNKGGCAFVAGLLHFFYLAAFCWMCLEGVQLYRMVVLVFNTTLQPIYMLLAGYGVPGIIVAISAAVNAQGYGTAHHCWLNLENGFIWSFLGPVCVVIIVNVVFFIITVWRLAEKFSSLNPNMSNLQKLRTFTITAIAQLCVLGTMWIFGCFQFEASTLAMSYIFTVLNSLQGVLIFIMHCLFSKPVRDEYSKFLYCTCIKEKKKYSESSSSQPLRISQSTGESQI